MEAGRTTEWEQGSFHTPDNTQDLPGSILFLLILAGAGGRLLRWVLIALHGLSLVVAIMWACHCGGFSCGSQA